MKVSLKHINPPKTSASGKSRRLRGILICLSDWSTSSDDIAGKITEGSPFSKHS